MLQINGLLYNYNGTKWNRTVSPRFDTNLYWNYADWYAPVIAHLQKLIV